MKSILQGLEPLAHRTKQKASQVQPHLKPQPQSHLKPKQQQQQTQSNIRIKHFKIRESQRKIWKSQRQKHEAHVSQISQRRILRITPPSGTLPPPTELSAWASLPAPYAPPSTPTTPQLSSTAHILILAAVSPTLTESDFYRLARQNTAQNLEDWAGGLTKVIQNRSPHHRPLPTYYLFFETSSSATHYASSLHHLLPPNLPPQYTIIPARKLLTQAFQSSSSVPARLLSHIINPLTEPETHKVVLRLGMGRVTRDFIKGEIEKDGRGRNLSWRVEGVEGVGTKHASHLGEKEEIGIYQGEGTDGEEWNGVMDGNKEEKETGYSSFVIGFGDAVEARRFVRGWHGREIVDGRTGREVVVDVEGVW